MTRRACCTVVLLVLAAGSASSQTDVAPFAANYEGRKSVMGLPATAQARIELQRTAQHVLYTMRTTVRWTLVERRFLDCSVMRIEGARLLPLEFRHSDASDAENDVHTRFDWAAGKASTVRGAEAAPQVVDIAWPTWDAMSFQVALMALAPHKAAATVEQHMVLERGRLKEHQVEFSGAAPVAAGAAPLYRIASRKGEDEVLLWLLPQQGWQPQRLVIDGVTIERSGTAPAATPPLLAGQTPSCSARP